MHAGWRGQRLQQLDQHPLGDVEVALPGQGVQPRVSLEVALLGHVRAAQNRESGVRDPRRIPDYQERLRGSGAGISTRLFLEHGLLPTLRTLGTSRAELKTVLRKRGSIVELPTTE